ncbi:ASCH domain-containing protein [Chengkuizengella axinellae]|uniref:ASCH domain-containing protein n=1 Tax=Chengkuizengella axinellae TaxID=3064388 RepID=A0ABT9IZZ5_9BACL|nr:ASCH domain-containing protein [Chengkuizengella sp. 2205SS18-9]MDP5274946.1 ASCH domain-containing protein [Chengkuizengella sp. 2205SS18-9]
MIHKMGLFEEYYTSVKEGKKIVEVRLNDEKRRRIKLGDKIKFIKLPEENEIIYVEVLELIKYDTFKAMYEDIPFQQFDCEGWRMEDMLKGTYQIYTSEQENKWGTLAIKMKVLNDC